MWVQLPVDVLWVCEGNRSDGQAFISLTKPEELPELPLLLQDPYPSCRSMHCMMADGVGK